MDWWISSFSTTVRESETKDGFKSGHIDVLLEPADIRVHMPNILAVDKDESLLWVEPKSNDIFDVFVCKFGVVAQILIALPLPEILLIIRDLNH